MTDKILGPGIRSLKVNITSIKPKPVKYDVAEIPPEIIEQYKNLTHCMGIMFVNEMPIITGIDSNIKQQYQVCLNSH